MKLKKILPGFAALFLLSFFITSCLNDDNLIPPNCFDGILNNGEFDVDCGGTCDPCPPSCTNGLWDADFGETDIDCGGPNCEACPTCNDLIMNQDEIGIDCGGENCEPCGTGGSCLNGVLDGDEQGVDCGGSHCPPCAVPTCDDGVMNGDEEGVDCGGSCPGCPEPSCEDEVMNALETGIDCGDGLFCPDCRLANQGQIIFRTNNNGFDVYNGSASAVADMTNTIFALTLNGSSGGEEITFLIPNAQEITAGQTINFNAATGGTGYVVGLEYGVFGNFLTNTANSGLNVTFEEIGTTAGSVVKGTFDGVMYNFTESFNLNFTEGSFNLIVQ